MRVSAAFGVACIALVAAFIGALGVGRYPLSPWDVLHVLSGHGSDTARAVVMQARLPRLLAAALLGGALSVSGGAYQAVLRNPLVSPGMLGVLSGAAFGAAGAILLGASAVMTQIGAFGGGVAAVAVGLCIARMLGTDSVFTLLLGGIISNAAFTALVSLIKYVADPFDQLPAIVYWLLGSVAQVGWGQLEALAPLLLAGTLVLLLCARILDVLSLSDDEARSLGIPVTALRLGVIAVATLVSAMTVSLAGIIGWIGLLVPHLARLLVGAAHVRMLPLSLVLGAICLVVADTTARTLSAGEIPLGIITELFGAAAFVLVLRRLRGSVP